nr:balbiani ring protein 3-like [Nomia melanderi]
MRQWFLVAVVASAIALIEGTEEIECPKNATRDEVTIPHETDCQKYYLCVGQEKVNMTCDQYKCFNPELRACDWPWMVPCCSTYVMTSRPFTCRDKEPHDKDCQKYLQNGILKCCPEYQFYSIDTCTCEPVSEVPPGRCFPPPKGEPPCWTWTTDRPDTTTANPCTNRRVYDKDCQKYLENGIRKCCPDLQFYDTATCTCRPQIEAPRGRCRPLHYGEEACWTWTTDKPDTTTANPCTNRKVYDNDCQKYLENDERQCCPDLQFYDTVTCTCRPQIEAPRGRCKPLHYGEEACWTWTTDKPDTTTANPCTNRKVYDKDCQKYLENGELICCPDKHFYDTATCTCKPESEVPPGRCTLLPSDEESCWKWTTEEPTSPSPAGPCAGRKVYGKDCQKYWENGERKCCPQRQFYSTDSCTCRPECEAPTSRCNTLPNGEIPCWMKEETVTELSVSTGPASTATPVPTLSTLPDSSCAMEESSELPETTVSTE